MQTLEEGTILKSKAFKSNTSEALSQNAPYAVCQCFWGAADGVCESSCAGEEQLHSTQPPRKRDFVFTFVYSRLSLCALSLSRTLGRESIHTTLSPVLHQEWAILCFERAAGLNFAPAALAAAVRVALIRP